MSVWFCITTFFFIQEAYIIQNSGSRNLTAGWKSLVVYTGLAFHETLMKWFTFYGQWFVYKNLTNLLLNFDSSNYNIRQIFHLSHIWDIQLRMTIGNLSKERQSNKKPHRKHPKSTKGSLSQRETLAPGVGIHLIPEQKCVLVS